MELEEATGTATCVHGMVKELRTANGCFSGPAFRGEEVGKQQEVSFFSNSMFNRGVWVCSRVGEAVLAFLTV